MFGLDKNNFFDKKDNLSLKELKLFREEWFQDEKNRNIYNSLNSISGIDKLYK